MRQLLLKALVIALVFGVSVGFLDSFMWIRSFHRYDPPLSTAEMQDMAKLPAAEMQLRLMPREKHFTRMEWLTESIRCPYFWKGVGQKSIFPVIGTLLGCLCLGSWNLRANKTQKV